MAERRSRTITSPRTVRMALLVAAPTSCLHCNNEFLPTDLVNIQSNGRTMVRMDALLVGDRNGRDVANQRLNHNPLPGVLGVVR